MAPLCLLFLRFSCILAVAKTTLAGFNPRSSRNVAVYWGQNSFNQGSGRYSQQRLSYYCQNANVDIIPISFMNGITPPITNFANAGDNCTAFSDNANLLSCPQIEADIQTCQNKYGKTIILSLGGATYSQGGWTGVTDAQSAAQKVWDMFGPVTPGRASHRPFGSAVVDGFDFDFESPVSNLPAFGQKLRRLMDAASDKKFYLSAAPQCVFPDAAVGSTINAVAFDFVMVQFYNNWCGIPNFRQGSATQNAFNFDEWDNWAKRTSLNRNVKVLLGIPAAVGAGGGYTRGAQLRAAFDWSKRYSSFGGVMMWDMSQLYSNTGFLNEVVSNLQGGPTYAYSSATTMSTSYSTSTSSTTDTTYGATLVSQWGQCGGQGYTGSTQCKPPYQCIYGGQWWSSCH